MRIIFFITIDLPGNPWCGRRRRLYPVADRQPGPV